MAEYTNAEKVDMILAYGATDCNGRAAQRLYAERHPVRRTPAHTMFARLHQQLCETGSFQKAARNRDRTARTELNEEIVLDMVETTPSLSTRVDDSALHPFHYQRVQSLKECDFAPRQAFSQWYLQQRIANLFFAASVLFTDEASFSREGIFNTHKSHSWAAANPHVTRTRAAQDRFLVNIGRGGPVHWPPRSPDHSCLDYFFWGQMKSLVFETPVNSTEELVVRISAAAGEIRNTPEMLSNVRRSMKRRCEACITCGGRQFEHLL
ncbi:transposase-like protein [Trichonephila clavipes]|uniref:Transposase-like protein n=1 Tax=Trichonephila clavipes TaxID=2585209 RepID=A0A8X6SR45_TRICX|nr:transposase-like protein [Trichonephila clavipes]